MAELTHLLTFTRID